MAELGLTPEFVHAYSLMFLFTCLLAMFREYL